MIARYKEQHFFHAELAKLLEAGFDIRKAADVMLSTSLPRRQSALLEEVVAGLDAGKSIADAFGVDRSRVTDLERNIIRAGEKGGRLAQSFRHLADYFQLLASVRAEAIRSMIYPLFVLHLGIFVAVVPNGLMQGDALLTEILPRFAGVLVLFYLVGLVVLFAVKKTLDAAPGNAGLDRWIQRIPLIGKARLNLAMARFTRVYHACVMAGLPPSLSLDLASGSSHSGVIRKASLPLVAEAEAGGMVSPQMIASRAFPAGFARSYATAEESGSLDTDMERWSGIFQEQAESAARAVSAVLPKILYFMILAFVVWQILGFFSGYYEALDQIGE